MQSYDAKTRYALLAALDLAALHAQDQPARLRDIARRTGAPSNYLVHVLLALKRRALVRSTRGPAGGYALMRPPALISVAEVVAAVESRRRTRAPAAGAGYAPLIDEVFAQAERQAHDFLVRVTLADLVDRLPGPP
ncbi:MAG: Rrf2 family transcriptional regulator [Candidatus Brocadiaceae bacterium]|nr:Rrf2 family transcriptional regulator [Candidatus Brocadiaceae bacterium]